LHFLDILFKQDAPLLRPELDQFTTPGFTELLGLKLALLEAGST